MFIKIMDRYISRQSISGMFTWVGAVTVIMLVQILFELADFFVNKKVPFLITLEILLMYVPSQMVLTFPISYLLASELNLGRLGRDSELVAIEASGVSLKRILLPYLVLSVVVSIGSFGINNFVVPEANHKAQVLLREYVYKKGPPKIEQNVFFRDAENRYFYVNELDNQTWIMKDVMVYEMKDRGGFPDVILAKNAYWQDDQWFLKEGVVHRYDENGFLVQEIEFSEMNIDMREEFKDFFEKQREPEEMSTGELKRQIQILKTSGVNTEQFEVAYYLKFSIPFSALMFVLIGLPLGIQRTRDARALGVIVTVILAFGYYMMLSVFRSLGRGGIMQPWLAAWMPDFIFGCMGAVLYLTVDRK
ncbi:MAG: LptF/LptG family permease [Candidatus Atribacteria bacterium]|nr:LptF/LptG family permease [Candidatus Atribacteria bacterium]